MTYVPTPFQDPAAGLNAEFAAIKDDLDALRAAGAHADGAWTDLPLLSGWVNYGDPYLPAQYRVLANGDCQLRGLVKNGTIGQPLAKLAKGPAKTQVFTAIGNAQTARFDVEPDGTVRVSTPTPPSGWLSITTPPFTPAP